MLAKLTNGQYEFALLVRSDMQRRRIGSALTYRAFGEAVHLGASQVVAHVRSDNTAARALLRSTGFCPISGPGLEVSFLAELAPSHAFGYGATANARAEREHIGCR
ncbi:GNAT family N-acetyltransferase [Methylocystis borbori]|uniref:GNAT family N-acetyltransferase n=1 Tax=Methylocystis borbori TaxID=3118750 RepID=UPI0038CC0881